MFEAFMIIAAAIFAGLTAYSAVWVALTMNKRFIKTYIRAVMDATSEAMATEIKNKTEEEIERIRWTDNC